VKKYNMYEPGVAEMAILNLIPTDSLIMLKELSAERIRDLKEDILSMQYESYSSETAFISKYCAFTAALAEQEGLYEMYVSLRND